MPRSLFLWFNDGRDETILEGVRRIRAVKRRIAKSIAAWTVYWFGSAMILTFLVTHRVSPRFEEPPPAIPWGTFTSERLATADGEDLGAWFVDGSCDSAPAVVFLHGVASCRRQLLAEAEDFHRRGCSCLLISQRGHGDSTGGYNDFGYGCRGDVTAAVDWLKNRCPDRPVVVWGTSMGAASALFAAEENGTKVAGYILECPYQNLRIATRNRTRLILPPGIEVMAYHTLNLVAPLSLPHVDDIDPAAAASRMPRDIPMLILAGGKDRLALPEEARAIGERVGASAKVVVVPEGGHTFLLAANPDLVRGEIDGLLKKIRR